MFFLQLLILQSLDLFFYFVVPLILAMCGAYTARDHDQSHALSMALTDALSSLFAWLAFFHSDQHYFCLQLPISGAALVPLFRQHQS